LIDDKEAPMRWIYLAVIILLAAATIIFAAQNLEIVTISFLGSNARVPLALLVTVTYLLGALGAATGGTPVRAAAPTVRRVETKHDGLVLNLASFHLRPKRVRWTKQRVNRFWWTSLCKAAAPTARSPGACLIG
jgi:putative membrane protein